MTKKEKKIIKKFGWKYTFFMSVTEDLEKRGALRNVCPGAHLGTLRPCLE